MKCRIGLDLFSEAVAKTRAGLAGKTLNVSVLDVQARLKTDTVRHFQSREPEY
jgi:hypothetical protein